MGLPRFTFIFLYIIAAFVLIPLKISAQIVFKEYPGYELNTDDSSFFDLSRTRSISTLNGEWRVYSPEEEKQVKVPVTVPSVFEGNGELVFEKPFPLTSDEIDDNQISLIFMGINYSADILLNDVVIFKHQGGEFPFKVALPRDILRSSIDNILSVRLSYKLDSENTIPLKQRFLFPGNMGGIFRDVYLHFTPNIFISKINYTLPADIKSKKIDVAFNLEIENREFRVIPDSITISREFELNLTMIDPMGGVHSAKPALLQIKRNEKKTVVHRIELTDPALWSPVQPGIYKTVIEISVKGLVIDRTVKNLALYTFTSGPEGLLLNGDPFIMKGVTFIPSPAEGNSALFRQMEDDIRLMRETGFNSVRFTRGVPHPYYLSLCLKYGLISFVEIPVGSLPSLLAGDETFIEKARVYLAAFLEGYRNYVPPAAAGSGCSFLMSVESHRLFISEMSRIIKQQGNILSYASFADLSSPKQIKRLTPIENLDLYGFELLHKPIASDSSYNNLLMDTSGAGRVFVSEATYLINSGIQGYVNKHTPDAQAKYFEDLMNYLRDNKGSGYFIHSMFDIRGDYASLVSGYEENHLYKLGILPDDRTQNRIAFRVIKSKLQETERVTIPIGDRKDDAPMIFIVSGLLFAIFIGVLVNSGRKFREDLTRALLRPYNFYSDVRDQRIISGYHTTVLALINAAVSALVISNVLYFLKDSVIFERILLSFGSPSIMNTVSYLAWNPFYAIIWLTIAVLVLMLAFVIIIKIASFFVRTKVYLSSVYFVVVWSFIPVVLLIPVGIILYRLLISDIGNIYIDIFLLLFLFWIFYRLIKGTYVIFDVNPGKVYLYSFIITVAVIAAFVLYFEINNSFLKHLLLVFRQYDIMGF